jgi:hypothetical protein
MRAADAAAPGSGPDRPGAMDVMLTKLRAGKARELFVFEPDLECNGRVTRRHLAGARHVVRH